MAGWGRALGRVPVETVFSGGGTPSLLEPGQMGAILKTAAGVFGLAADAEDHAGGQSGLGYPARFLEGVRAGLA